MARLMGFCSFCGRTYLKSGMGRHLAACAMRKDEMNLPALDEDLGEWMPVRKTQMFHIRAEGNPQAQYWMHFEVAGDMTLEMVDRFLRDVWLECCGHLSAFTIEGQQYLRVTDDMYPEDKDMNIRLDALLEPDTTFAHEYDFGTTTTLKLKVVDVREGQARGLMIQILAENNPPEITCGMCGEQPAVWVCPLCVWSTPDAWLCEECAPKHECGKEMMLPVVNSPRVGMCGYGWDYEGMEI